MIRRLQLALSAAVRALKQSKWLRSFYVKVFMSFLLTCAIFFVSLVAFWNYYFTDLVYKDKIELLSSRSEEVVKLLSSQEEGSLSVRELKLGVRLIGRSFTGFVWVVDENGTLDSSTNDSPNTVIPKTLDAPFMWALRGESGHTIVPKLDEKSPDTSFLVYYKPTAVNDKRYIIFMLLPVSEISSAISAFRLNLLLPLVFSLLAVAFILLLISRRLAGPLRRMNLAAEAMTQGDFTVRVPVQSKDEFGSLARSFNVMVDQLQQWEDTRKEFLATVSHELRSPLTTLRGLIVALSDKLVPEDQVDRYLAICHGEVLRLQRLVTDLLDLARIQNGGGEERLERVRLEEKVGEVLEVVSTRLHEKRLELRTMLPAAGTRPLVCTLDPDRFVQILQNLLYNAIQFTPEGGTIRLSLQQRGDEAEIIVADTGIGMDEEQLSRIWERFYKADQSRGLHTEGTGLGLTIVKHLVSAMKGTIQADSRKGEGTTFTVRFPLVKPDPRR
ncbi:sensor histidine kinase [Paenibacillus sp. y28]|uniref:sensor histidine kinase n=1 Tax=Paenibacillus sp. y28 TaxID=3129110 RepID=UPI00301A7EDE